MTLVLVAAAWWSRPPDPAAEVRAHRRQLVTLDRVPLPHVGRGVERWVMIAAGGDTVVGLWRPGAPQQGARWAAVIIGGIETDDRAALLVPDSLPIGILAVSWPWRGPRHMSVPAFVASVPAVRAALIRTPAALARGMEAVHRAYPDTRVLLLGASLGAPPVAAAVSVARPDALVLVDGAADLGRLLRSETTRALGGGIAGAMLGPPAGALGARLVSSLEPSRHGAAAQAIPVLLVDPERDYRYPPECVARLHATFPHASRRLHPGGHMHPDDRPQLTRIIDIIWQWLNQEPALQP